MDELKSFLRQEIVEDDLDAIVGGNDDVKGKDKGYDWTCPGCGAVVHVVQEHDKAKHCAHDCPAPPWR